MLSDLTLVESTRLAAIEAERQARLGASASLNRVSELICELVGVPTGLVTLVGDELQWIVARTRFDCASTSRENAFCKYTVARRALTVIEDATQDERVKENPLVIRAPNIRFYAGVPLITSEGHAIGSVCAIDYEPRRLTGTQARQLRMLGDIATDILEARHRLGMVESITLFPNCHQLRKDLGDMMQPAAQAERYSLFMISTIDINYMNDITSSFGGVATDTLICDVAALLQLLMPSEWPLYAVSPSRFAFVVPFAQRAAALECIDLFSDRMEDYHQGSIPIRLDVHAGVHDFDTLAMDGHEVYRKALNALHAALSMDMKVLGYRAGYDDEQREHLQLMIELATSIEARQDLFMVYQPKVDLKTNRIVGLEALLRWNHPRRGMIPPGEFISLVDKTNLINPLTYRVFEMAAAMARTCYLAGGTARIAINISTSNLLDDGMVDMFSRILEKEQARAEWLELECLETEGLLDNTRAVATLIELKTLGFRLSIDDFGAGHSNINYLRRLPTDVIKIDRYLISDIATDPASRFIVEKIVEMAHFLALKVVAEGIENEPTLALLRAMHCDAAQGYHLFRPMPEAEAFALVAGCDDTLAG
ncbi:EAL domain-containing protein [Larsenimonas rhizosphaerae]|uniref:EAL domain-containing protein n=1 Tax=Larsenimonas rhizosphaerae TaxID=2944682 RepID=UPI002034A0EF|nr:sensor domain-containing phosphodiesterase [Larsenimonas rhizosphaerae]MCM2129529.1 sensor domain-containing phosphodiesterase [Larsenimonas rhizosphaerae]